jgi:hypothetical protein
MTFGCNFKKKLLKDMQFLDFENYMGRIFLITLMKLFIDIFYLSRSLYNIEASGLWVTTGTHESNDDLRYHLPQSSLGLGEHHPILQVLL